LITQSSPAVNLRASSVMNRVFPEPLPPVIPMVKCTVVIRLKLNDRRPDSSGSCLNEFGELSQGVGTMAHRVFLLVRHFGECSLVALRHKQRIISKSALSPLFCQNGTFYDPFKPIELPILIDVGEHALEAGGAIVFAFQFFQQQPHVFYAVAMFARVSCRADTRLTVEGIHLKPAVV